MEVEDGGVVTIRISYPHDGVESGDTMPTDAFLTRVVSIEPTEVSEPNSTFQRVVNMRRISDITKDTQLLP